MDVFRRYHITLVKKISKNEYKVYEVFPNEDHGFNEPIICEYGNYWDGIGTIQNFEESEIDIGIEYCKALDDLFAFSMLDDGKHIFFNSVKEIEENIDKLEPSDTAIFINF